MAPDRWRWRDDDPSARTLDCTFSVSDDEDCCGEGPARAALAPGDDAYEGDALCERHAYLVHEITPSPYISLYVARGVAEAARKTLRKATEGLAESNPSRRFLAQLETALDREATR